MVRCSFANSLNCTQCEFIYYNKCPKFVKAHFLSLNRDIWPFVRKPLPNISDSIIWSKDENVAKTFASNKSLQLNSPVKKLSISQVISAVLSGTEFDSKVFYIEYKQKTPGDADKVKSCLVSFIDNASLSGCSIACFISPSVSCSLDYRKL